MLTASPAHRRAVCGRPSAVPNTTPDSPDAALVVYRQHSRLLRPLWRTSNTETTRALLPHPPGPGLGIVLGGKYYTTCITAGSAGHEVHYNMFLPNGFWFPTLKFFYSPHEFFRRIFRWVMQSDISNAKSNGFFEYSKSNVIPDSNRVLPPTKRSAFKFHVH